MQPDRTERRLVAIMFTDIVGSTAATARSESAGLALRDRHRGLVRPLVEAHRGRLIEAPGDQSLSIFDSAVDAAHCALAIQQAADADLELQLHIGVHLGEIVLRGHEVFGDGINIAARICALSDGNAPNLSDEVAQAIRNQPNLKTTPLGTYDLKNVGRPVAVRALTGEPAGRTPARSDAPLTSIAVLPFDDMSPGADQKWLADGMAEELIETLSRIEALRVPARTSAFALRGKDIRTVGAELRVGSVVEGSVRRSGDQLRITAQLIRVSDGYHLWSARYDRKLADVFAIQTEIARAIAEAIRGELGIEYEYSWLRSYEPSDVRAYELVKKGINSYLPLSEAGLRQAIEYYEQALAIDPDYAEAHVELGWAYFYLWDFFGRSEADFATARAQAERVLASDATNGSAHNLRARVLYRQYEWEEARQALDRGFAHNPGHGLLRYTSALLLATEGRTAEALVEMGRAADLDPWRVDAHLWLGRWNTFVGEYDAAVDELERAWDLAPGARGIHRLLAYAYHRSGRGEEALEAWVRELPPELAGLETAVRQGFTDAGFAGAVRARHEWLVAKSARPFTIHAGSAAWTLAILGETDAMFECLREAIDRRDEVFLEADPVFDPYRADPRFTALLRRMNLAE